MYPGFEADGKYDSTAAAFSPDGKVLYLATTANVLLALDSDGSTTSHVVKYTGGSDLCDIAVSPDGLSVSWVLHPSRKTFQVRDTFSKELPRNRLIIEPTAFPGRRSMLRSPRTCGEILRTKLRHLCRDLLSALLQYWKRFFGRGSSSLSLLVLTAFRCILGSSCREKTSANLVVGV